MKAKPFSTVDEYGSSHEIDVARATCTRPLPTYCNRALTLRFSSLGFSEATVDGGRTLDEYRSSHWMIRTQCPRPTPIRGRDLFKEFLEGLDDDDEEDEETLFDSRSLRYHLETWTPGGSPGDWLGPVALVVFVSPTREPVYYLPAIAAVPTSETLLTQHLAAIPQLASMGLYCNTSAVWFWLVGNWDGYGFSMSFERYII